MRRERRWLISLTLGDVHMHKVKFNTNQEYEYINNFKVLQACFAQHGIDKVSRRFHGGERMILLGAVYPGGSTGKAKVPGQFRVSTMDEKVLGLQLSRGKV